MCMCCVTASEVTAEEVETAHMSFPEARGKVEVARSARVESSPAKSDFSDDMFSSLKSVGR